MTAAILIVAIGILGIVIWRISRNPRGFLEGMGALGVVGGSIALVFLLPELPAHWREFSLWRGLIFGSLLVGLPLTFSKNRLALVLAAVGYCVLRLGVAGVFWLAKHA